MKTCPHCSKSVAEDAIKCPHCEGLVVKDQKALLKIVEDFEGYLLDRGDSLGVGILLGIPESYLPYKKETIEQALEFFMLVYAVELLRTGSAEAEIKFNVYELNFLALAEYFPDKEMLFYDIVISKDDEQAKSNQLSVRLQDEPNIQNFERWSQRMRDNENKYYEKVKQIKLKAEALKEKMSGSEE